MEPVDDAIVEATLEYFSSPVVADMLQVQRLTGARPGELCAMRPCEIDRTDDVWVYTPAKHKTQHHGHKRQIAVGPKAQEILLHYLARAPRDFLFSPL